MGKTIQTQEFLTTGKAVYEKPTSQVYELESTGEASPADYGYDSRGRWE